MEQTANLQLPYIMPSQAQKHVTHNEAIRSLDALVQLSVLDRHLAVPPALPADGARYLVATGGSDAWTGKDGKVAAWQDGTWAFLAPKAGWVVWVVDESRLIGFDGASWMDAAVHSVNPAPLVGVNTTADATNRLSVKSPAALFDAELDDHRLKINKAAAGNTASLLFQSGYSGRAEFGLAGDDDWHVKVSPDGTVWTEALQVDRTTGRVRLPAALPLSDDNQAVARRHVREKLAANRTYYVRTDGNDSNTGLSNTSGGAFLTIQKALDIAYGALDLSGFAVTVQIGNGTYTGPVVQASPQVGAGSITLQGDNTTPGNVVISRTSQYCVIVRNSGTILYVRGLRLQNTGAGDGMMVEGGASLVVNGNMEFGAIAWSCMRAERGGVLHRASGNFTFAGSAQGMVAADYCGVASLQGGTWTMSGTPAWAVAGIMARYGACAKIDGVTFSGSATGQRYNADYSGTIFTNGGGASYVPGNAAGSDNSGRGHYA